MPWRLVLFIIIFAIFLIFITFNLGYKCDISFFGAVVSDVPVFLTIFYSFIAGLLCALPLALRIAKKRKHKSENENKLIHEKKGITGFAVNDGLNILNNPSSSGSPSAPSSNKSEGDTDAAS